MKFEELKNKSKKQLIDLLAEKRSELRSLRFKVTGNQLKNVARIKEIKRDIAKILTTLNKNLDLNG